MAQWGIVKSTENLKLLSVLRAWRARSLVQSWTRLVTVSFWEPQSRQCCWVVQYAEVSYGGISSPRCSIFSIWIETRYQMIESNVAEKLLQAGVLGWDQICVWTVSEMRSVVQTSWNTWSTWMSSCVFIDLVLKISVQSSASKCSFELEISEALWRWLISSFSTRDTSRDRGRGT